MKRFLNIKSKKGSSLTEMLMVISLIALFGFALVVLIISGARAHSRIGGSMVAENEARIALSFINVKIRQHDAAESVSLYENGDIRALRFDTELEEDFTFSSWVFFEDGVLHECSGLDSLEPSVEIADKIAEVRDCKFEIDGNKVKTTITYDYSDDQTQNMTSMITLRSGEVR